MIKKLKNYCLVFLLVSVASAQPERVLVKPDGTFELVLREHPISPAESALIESVPVYSVLADGSMVLGVTYRGNSESGYHSTSFPGRVVLEPDGSWFVQRVYWTLQHGPKNMDWEFKIEDSDTIPVISRNDIGQRILRGGPSSIGLSYDLAHAPAGAAAPGLKAAELALNVYRGLLKDESINFVLKLKWADLGSGGTLGGTPVWSYEYPWGPVKTRLQANYAASSTDADPWEFVVNNNYPSSPINYNYLSILGNFMTGSTPDVCLTELGQSAIYGSAASSRVILVNCNSSVKWDFNPANGILAGHHDFVGMLVHEFGHLMGVSSRVDDILTNSATSINLWDVYRMPDTGATVLPAQFVGNNRELGHGESAVSVLSLSNILFQPSMSTGNEMSFPAVLGDGRQASHWKDDSVPPFGLTLGIMDPSISPGESLSVGGSYLQPNDVRAFDLLGFDINEDGIPFFLPFHFSFTAPVQGSIFDTTTSLALNWNSDPEVIFTDLAIYDLGFASEANSEFELGAKTATTYLSTAVAGSTHTIQPEEISLIPGHRYQVHAAVWTPFGPNYTQPMTFTASGTEPSYIPQWGDFTESARLLPSDAEFLDNDFFGDCAALSGDWAAIGGILFADNPGRVYLFKKDNSRWIHQQTIHAPNPVRGDGRPKKGQNNAFGGHVEISGDLMVISNQLHQTLAPGDNPGIVYVYRFNGSEWVIEDELSGSDTDANDYFGGSIAIQNDTIAVGAVHADTVNGVGSGAVYVFEKANGVWGQVAKLLEDPSNGDSTENRFGSAVSISGIHMIVGSIFDEFHGERTGSATVFKHDGVQWIRQQSIFNSSPIIHELFGAKIAIEGDTAIITAPGGVGAFGDVVTSAGRAFVYEYDGLVWNEVDVLSSGTGIIGEGFGFNIDIDENLAVISAGGASSEKSIGSGVCYVYRKNSTTGTWVRQVKLKSADGEDGNIFGFSWGLAIDDGVVICGAPLTDGSSNGPFFQGSAFVFELNQCPADLNSDGSLNFLDVSAFLDLFGAQDPSADWNNDGNFNFLDNSGFIDDFATGCP